jgi:GTPase SAR1 family protein
MSGPHPARYRVVFIGPSSAGKTSILQRFAKGTFYEQHRRSGRISILGGLRLAMAKFL